jgi:hypothetical protein
VSRDSGRSAAKITTRFEPVEFEVVEASRPHGNVTRQQLLDLGMTSSGIARRVRAGRLFPSWSGVYGVGRPPRSPLEKADAAVKACGPGAGLFGPSAMSLFGFWRRWREPFEVVAPGDRNPRGLIVHRSKFLGPAEMTTHLGIRVTRPARTMFDMEARWNDTQLHRYVDRALHSNYLKRGHLEAQILRHPHHRAARRLQWFVAIEGGPTQSDWQRALPEWCARHDLPIPVFEVVIAGHSADAVFVRERVVLELDSWEYHNERVNFEHDRDLDVDRLVEHYETVRLTWERMFGRPEREANRLRKLLESRRS